MKAKNHYIFRKDIQHKPWKLIFVLAILFCTYGSSSAKARIDVDHSTYNFGTILEANGTVSHEFIVTNTGDQPLVIISASSSCGCTVPKIPKQPIKPGEKATIKVTYNPAGRPGEFEKSIKVKSNASNSRTILKIIGTVMPKSGKK